MRDATDDPHPMQQDGRAAAPAERTVRLASEVDAPAAGAMRPALLGFRAEVASLARERRDAGVGVERVIPEVRRLAREAASAAGVADAADSVAAHAVRWSVEAYFDEPALRHVPRFY